MISQSFNSCILDIMIYLGVPEPLLDILDLLLQVFLSLSIVIACKCELNINPIPCTEICTDLNTDVNFK